MRGRMDPLRDVFMKNLPAPKRVFDCYVLE